MDSKYIKLGVPTPLGATISEQGVNFALFSKHARHVTLCFMDVQSKAIIARVPLDPEKHRTGHIWHVYIEGLKLPLLYGYRIDGCHNSPHYYDPRHLVVDPYAKILDADHEWGKARKEYHPKGVLMQLPPFDWQEVSFPCLQLKDLVIYELHVRGFTRDCSSKAAHPGSFLGVIDKIPYLVDLGINAVELMPMQEFNECANERKHPDSKAALFNYWGYSSLNFFAPMHRYATSNVLGAAITEFKMMVRELHRHGIEVILDVVFNHTGEKRSEDKLLSFVGIDRVCYYLLSHGRDTNYTGCGNTLNTTYPAMHQMILNCLHYWVTEMKVDGFRFDLASVFNRDTQGNLLPMSSVIASLSDDPVLAKTKLIAEPWDAAGAYQLGAFYPHESRWSEWNGKYRDSLRRFIKGDQYSKNEFSHRLCGSQGLFPLRSPQASINFVTAHDGFTLYDLVSYNRKHNLANGEGNRDGNNSNISWNHGAEGDTDDPHILAFRFRQMKNFIVALMISRGVPMLFMGDEYGHTKHGNNNTWCQDGKINWFLWDQVEKNKAFYRFVRRLIHFRHEHSILTQEDFLGEGAVVWHGTQPHQPHWEQEHSLLACSILDRTSHEDLYVIFNATNQIHQIMIPEPPQGKNWHIVVDTFAAAPMDCFEIGAEPRLDILTYTLHDYSSLLLKAV
jgi:isoamylase